GKIIIHNNVTIRGSFEVRNNTNTGILHYGGIKVLERCIIKVDVGDTRALFHGYKLQNITFINCTIEIVSGFLARVDGGDSDYTGIGSIATFKGINTIKYHTTGGLLQRLTAFQTGGIKWTVEGELITNALIQ